MPAPNSAAAHRRYVSLGQAAEYVGISERTLRRLIASGELTGYRLAGHRRTIRLDLNEIEAQMRPIPTAAYGTRGGAA